MKYSFLAIVILFLLSCSESDSTLEEQNEIPESTNFIFEDGFETSNQEFNELFPQDGSRWTNIQIVNPTVKTNTLTLSSIVVKDGNSSLAVLSNQSDEILSKADIEKSGLQASAGSTVTIEADFYIDSDKNLENLLLIDLECCSCWDPSVPENQCPGVRLMLSGGDDYLSIERGKIAGDLLLQTTTKFPRKEWVTVRWESTLSPNEDGANKLFLNGNQILSENGMNMPNAEIFRALFTENDIDFELQEPVSYERVQIGATANPDAEDLLLYVDNFSIQIEKN